MANAAARRTMGDCLLELGGIAADRVRLTPTPGIATLGDVERANEDGTMRCELIDQTLVEKAMGYEASVVAAAIVSILCGFTLPRKPGVVSGPDGMFQLVANLVRGPDVAFVARQRFPQGKLPAAAYPSLAPDLAVEVLSPGNTKGEMSRKRSEYFDSGVRLVWIVDCAARSVAVYTSPDGMRVYGEHETIDGGEVLPGFSHPVKEFFAELDMLLPPKK